MNVAAILREKGSHVVTVRETLTLEEAAAVLDSNSIGALVVTDQQGRATAVLSERDIVRELALNGAAALSRPIAHALTQAFVTAALDDTLADVMVRMTERRARHLPVIEKEKLVGIVSIGDVVRFKIADIEAETAAIREYILS
jgi:CBS domain-containing protein